jgi:hypothetical protein
MACASWPLAGHPGAGGGHRCARRAGCRLRPPAVEVMDSIATVTGRPRSTSFWPASGPPWACSATSSPPRRPSRRSGWRVAGGRRGRRGRPGAGPAAGRAHQRRHGRSHRLPPGGGDRAARLASAPTQSPPPDRRGLEPSWFPNRSGRPAHYRARDPQAVRVLGRAAGAGPARHEVTAAALPRRHRRGSWGAQLEQLLGLHTPLAVRQLPSVAAVRRSWGGCRRGAAGQRRRPGQPRRLSLRSPGRPLHPARAQAADRRRRHPAGQG